MKHVERIKELQSKMKPEDIKWRISHMSPQKTET